MANRQSTFDDFFDRTDRQRDARRRLIESLPVHQRVIDLLLAIDELSQDRGIRQPDGSMLLSVPLEVLIWKLNRSRNTVRACIDSAGGTPYLAVTPSQHRSHTYLLRWPVIVDDSRPVEGNTGGGCPQDARTTATGRSGVTPRRPAPKGVRTPAGGGQLTPSKGVNQGVNLPPSLQDPGLCISGVNEFKNPGSSVETSARAELEGVSRHRSGFWQRWRTELSWRDLGKPDHVQELYELAVSEGCFPDSEHNRLQVFAQAAHDRRVAKSPKALFRENVAVARWLCSAEDEDIATAMMAAADGMGRLVAAGVEASSTTDRQTEIEKLQRWQREKGRWGDDTARR